MAKTPLTGSRIRGYRIDKGLRQAALARQCDISASYLNLIEHNRRRIGGALLLKIADALDVDAPLLTGGAAEALASAMDAAADALPDAGAERARADDLAARFPGWANLIAVQHRENRRLEQVIEQLGDRLTHDPFLSASMHNVLSSVTAIRSASGILAQGGDIEPEWQARFHRNIYEDSQRLAEATETLVTYLDSDAGQNPSATLPQDEIDAWLTATNWRIEALEADPTADVAAIVDAAPQLSSTASRRLAQSFLGRYVRDVTAVPADALQVALQETSDPGALAQRFGVDLPCIFRRLAAVPADDPSGSQGLGLVACDASGTLIYRKPAPDFDLPRYSAACPLWPLFQALQRPMTPVRQTIGVSGRDETSFDTMAIASIDYPTGFGGPAVVEAWMLIRPMFRQASDAPDWRVGTSCRVCPEEACVARREPSVFAFSAAAKALTDKGH